MNDILRNILKQQGIEDLMPLIIEGRNDLYCYRKNNKYHFCTSDLSDEIIRQDTCFDYFLLDRVDGTYYIKEYNECIHDAILLNKANEIICSDISSLAAIQYDSFILGINKKIRPSENEGKPFLFNLMDIKDMYHCVIDGKYQEDVFYLMSIGDLNFYKTKDEYFAGNYTSKQYIWNENESQNILIWSNTKGEIRKIISEKRKTKSTKNTTLYIYDIGRYTWEVSERKKYTIENNELLLIDEIIFNDNCCIIPLTSKSTGSTMTYTILQKSNGHDISAQSLYEDENIDSTVKDIKLERLVNDFIVFRQIFYDEKGKEKPLKNYIIFTTEGDKLGQSNYSEKGFFVTEHYKLFSSTRNGFEYYKGVRDVQNGNVIVPEIFDNVELEVVERHNELEAFSKVQIVYKLQDKETILSGLYHNSELVIPIGNYEIERLSEGNYRIKE